MYVPHLKKCSACNRLIQLQLIADSLTDKLNLYETTLNRKSEMLRYITSDYHNQIVYVSENKIGDCIYVVKRSFLPESTDIELYLYCSNYDYTNINSLPFVFCSLEYSRNDCSKVLTSIKIDDICTKNYSNIGNGFIAIQGLKNVALYMKAPVIKGFLSPADIEHFDMLTYFYTRCGFDVSMNKSHKSGTLKLFFVVCIENL